MVRHFRDGLKMKNKQIKNISIIILVFCIVAIVITMMFSMMSSDYDQKIMYAFCCKGQPCSDTYYTSADNLCHLSLCEQMYFMNRTKCTYKGTLNYLSTLNNFTWIWERKSLLKKKSCGGKSTL